MRRKIITPSFLRRLGIFLTRHHELEPKIDDLMNQIVAGQMNFRVHALHGPLKGLYSARISKSYRIIFAVELDAIIFVNIGSHDEVY